MFQESNEVFRLRGYVWRPGTLYLACLIPHSCRCPAAADFLTHPVICPQSALDATLRVHGTLGSTIGCVFFITSRARQVVAPLLFFACRKQQRVKDLINRYDVLSVLVACLLPPPFPLKLFVVTPEYCVSAWCVSPWRSLAGRSFSLSAGRLCCRAVR